MNIRPLTFRLCYSAKLPMKCLLLAVSLISLPAQIFAQNFISAEKSTGYIPLIDDQLVPAIYTDAEDEGLVQKAAKFLQQDIEAVTGKKPEIINTLPARAQNIIIVGTIEGSSLIQQLATKKMINIDETRGTWDGYHLQAIDKPLDGIDHALVIAGGNRRGAAFGVFELSKQLGVSPWYWWADVPVKKKAEVYLKANTLVTDSPKVKYRGIFINDEAPCFTGWAKEKFGGINSKVYEKVFELLLRLKANYLWPAMWRNAFFVDDERSPELADEYGIVMGTSHHEPMLRNANEWKLFGTGDWNYETNGATFRDYWRKGIERMGNRESIVTVGMRGERDRPMTDGTPITLLESIVKDQRAIIAEVTGKPASETPQLWALYKEVQEYYTQGMQVPDDVTLLFCDDNWGNVRLLPKLTDKPRSGGAGMYYHFDFVGGPRSYKWINTNSISRVWEQMHLAYEFNARTIWIVNVGDIKPMEFPMSFFLDYAWDPTAIGPNDLQHYAENWAAEQFGRKYGNAIGNIIWQYSKFNNRVKPEILDFDTYSLSNYDEALRVTKEYNDLLTAAENAGSELPPEYEPAYFQLVLHPVEAEANLQELYTTVALNREAAERNSPEANAYADKAEKLFANDAAISAKYNTLLDGKWNHMMDQPHIGKGEDFRMLEVQEMPTVERIPAGAVAKSEELETPEPITSKNLIPADADGQIFYESDGVVSMEAAHFTRMVNANGITWTVIPGIGKTGDGLTPFPVKANAQTPGEKDSPHVEYEFYSYSKGPVRVNAYFCPTLNFQGSSDGLRYAVSIDDEAPQVISLNKGMTRKIWQEWVANNIIIPTSEHTVSAPGRHVLKFWMVDAGIVAQKFVLDFGGVKSSHLGPPETLFERKTQNSE